MPDFPREEDLAGIVGDAEYIDGVRWRVFKSLDGEPEGVNVLVVMGDRWTMLSGADFRRLAERILPQL